MGVKTILFFVLGLVLTAWATDRATKDLMTSGLPATTFSVNFNQFSGYLNNGQLHYWYIESQHNASGDPLVVFFASAGCSSIYAMIEEIGPFRPYSDGSKLYENVFSWNKMANILVIDAPGIGFSPPSFTQLDNTMLIDLFAGGIEDFFTVFPERASNILYIGGQGQSSFIATGIARKFQNSSPSRLQQLKGIFLANARLNDQLNYNSFMSFAYVHGFAGKDEWDDLQSSCCPNQSTETCDYYGSTSAVCQKKAKAARTQWIPQNVNPMDIYQDCYQTNIQKLGIVNSTDPFNGYPCSASSAIFTYLSSTDVQKAFHSTQQFPGSCVDMGFAPGSSDLTGDVLGFIQHPSYINNNMTILVYNGDVDATFNFLGARQFVLSIAQQMNLNLTKDEIWNANYYRHMYNDTIGGLRMEFVNRLYFLTVTGGGAKTGITRPSQLLQMMRDFVNGYGFNNCLANVPKAAQPLLPQYQNIAKTQSRKEAALIQNLPGLTFDTNFKQYSGYLNAAYNSKIHYWLVEAQTDADKAPLIVWLHGGNLGSALSGLLTETGPFRTNQDGLTLSEHYYSWNKAANVLYLESPFGAGFSYSTSNDTQLNDDVTAEINYSALKDFLTVFPEYQSLPVYISGVSYGAIYSVTATQKILDGIQSGDLKMKFKGLMIGNGMLSAANQVNGQIFMMYTYGLLGQKEYDSLTTDCCSSVDPTLCDFFGPYFTIDNTGNPHIKDGANITCATRVLNTINYDKFSLGENAGNLYQDCYTPNTIPSILSKDMTFHDYAQLINTDSTDPFHGFPCWRRIPVKTYLNLDEVRTALHIPPSAPAWSNDGSLPYTHQYSELQPQLTQILTHSVYKANEARTLIYNGDVDLLANHISAQWFADTIAASINLTITAARTQWHYQAAKGLQKPTVGYAKEYSNHLTVATVKGAGHMSFIDRPAPILQMIYNFVNGKHVGTTTNLDTTPSPVRSEYQNLNTCKPMQQAAPSAYPPVPVPEFNAKVFNYTEKADEDYIRSLPGLPFSITYNMFSGYLTSTKFPQNHLFYWFMESQNDRVNDPVLLWLNGGPGCSALGGFFEELGPFHNNYDGGKTLYENVFSWNKNASVIFMEAPVGVGFSYTDDPHYRWNDDTTAENNAHAVKTFFEQVFPQYANNEFYIAGESYGGVYIPTLTRNLINMIQNKELAINFKGIAIGNGYLSHHDQVNSELTLQYGHGFNGQDDWKNLKSKCGGDTQNPIYFNYYAQPLLSQCYLTSTKMSTTYFDGTNTDPYDIYVDCYGFNILPDVNVTKEEFPKTRGGKARAARQRGHQELYSNRPFVDNNDLFWYGSTDPWMGLACYNDDQLAKYLNRGDVKYSIHATAKKTWGDCANLPYDEQPEYYDMAKVMDEIMNSPYYKSNNMRIMLYNGDADTICQFLGDQWWAERLVASRNLTVTYERQPWFYRKTPDAAVTLAGYVKGFSQNFVQMTVKGAGHMVPMDRPGEALQMINNFMFNKANYSEFLNADISRRPLYQEYQQTANPVCSRKDSDLVINLPGLPSEPSFRQYSGFLRGSPTHFLHYWLVESQQNQTTAPLILWLNGDPDVSSMDGLFVENGPFRLNRDGKTLSLNEFSWNKFANVLYLESPVGVGYSYTSDGALPNWSDATMAAETYEALHDFFNYVAPEYQRRSFYIVGDAYGGVYVPLLAQLIMSGMGNPLFLNFKGIAINNGVLDKKVDMNSEPHSDYFRGAITYSRYQNLLNLCCKNVADPMQCDFSQHFTNFSSIPYNGDPSDPCYLELLNFMGDIFLQNPDPLNLYQQCYEILSPGVTQGPPVGEPWTGINYESSDANGAYWCWYNDAIEQYMNLDGVRRALNIPDGTAQWKEMAGIVFDYNQQTTTTSDIFQWILSSSYYACNQFQMLFYSGDVDISSNWLGSEWFTNNLFENTIGLKVLQQRGPWSYSEGATFESTVAGYSKRFEKNVDVVTIRGSGLFTALDRPAQTLQMIFNWIAGQAYDTPFSGSVSPSPFKYCTATTPTSTTTTTTTPKTTSTAQKTTTTTTTTTPATTPKQGAFDEFNALALLVFVIGLLAL